MLHNIIPASQYNAAPETDFQRSKEIGHISLDLWNLIGHISLHITIQPETQYMDSLLWNRIFYKVQSLLDGTISAIAREWIHPSHS